MKSFLLTTGLALVCLTRLSAQLLHTPSGELMKAGIAKYDSGQYKEALAIYSGINRNDSNYTWALYESMLSCMADSQIEKGLEIYKLEVAADKELDYDAKMRTALGNLLDNAGRHDESLVVFDSAIAKYPLYGNLYLNKGIVLLRVGRRAEAEVIFQKALLLDPYLYSCHYFLAVAALTEGKILPATLSLMGYLLVSPDGKYNARAISFLSQIANAQDGVITYRDSLTGPPDAVWAPVEDIVVSKLALDKNYKPVIYLDDPISRQIQVCLEKISFQPGNPDFYMQYYMPFYSETWKNGQFELMINRMFSNANVEIINTFNKKNAKKEEAFVNDIAGYFNQVKRTGEINYSKRLTVENGFYFSEGVLAGKGVLSGDGKKAVGPWIFYYPDGTIKMRGVYTREGMKDGIWITRSRRGIILDTSSYRAGVQDGLQVNYYHSGICSSRMTMVNGKKEGRQMEYYPNGVTHYITDSKNDVMEGVVKEYFPDGSVKMEIMCHAGKKSGPTTSWFQNGQVHEKINYTNDELDGAYQTFNDTGSVVMEGRLIKGRQEGEWKYYHGNGKLQWLRHYQAGDEADSSIEFYPDGHKKATYPLSRNKIAGIVNYRDTDGIRYSRETYTDGILSRLEYFDKTGKQLENAQQNAGVMTGEHYDEQGTKNSHFTLDSKGKLTGISTTYFASGRVHIKSNYKDGEKDGVSVEYANNGTVISESPSVEGSDQGHYKNYYYNGRLKTEGDLEAGKAQGEWLYYNSFGKLTDRNFYLNGEQDGWQTAYYPDGRLNKEENYTHGFLAEVIQYDTLGRVLIRDTFPQGNGKFVLLYPDGRKMTEASYRNGVLEDKCVHYYFDGSVEDISWFHHGMQDSSYQSFFYGGAKAAEGNYRLGKKTGQWLTYSDEGKVIEDEWYSNDNRNGLCRYLTRAGLLYLTAEYKNDNRNGLTTHYSEDGQIGYQIEYREGKSFAYSYPAPDGKLKPAISISPAGGTLETFYANGKRSRRCRFEDGIITGSDSLYQPNGVLSGADSCSFNSYEGRRQEYFADGKPNLDMYYRDGVQHGVSRSYFPGGILRSEGTYYLGMQHGITRLYDKAGKLKSTQYYYYGKLYGAKNEK